MWVYAQELLKEDCWKLGYEVVKGAKTITDWVSTQEAIHVGKEHSLWTI